MFKSVLIVVIVVPHLSQALRVGRQLAVYVMYKNLVCMLTYCPTRQYGSHNALLTGLISILLGIALTLISMCLMQCSGYLL